MKHGRFVSFEGIEGCGKTTQIALLSEALTRRAISHSVTREPGGTAVGEGIRKILLHSETIHLTAAAELLLFYASRSQNILGENSNPRSQGAKWSSAIVSITRPWPIRVMAAAFPLSLSRS